MTKKILVLGANGMLGGSLHRYFTRAQHNVVGTVRSTAAQQQVSAMGFDNIRSGVDVTDPKTLEAVIADVKPDYVFNCIGLIKQLAQSEQPVAAIEMNSLLPHRLAELCSKYASRLVHFSTDCVFNGARGGYTEASLPDATDLYGRSKLLGEVAYGQHLTLRTSIIGHEIDSNLSLVDWFLSQRGQVKGFSKAVFSGLPTCYVAEFINNHVFPNPDLRGLYHLSVEPIDKYQLLSLIKERYNIAVDIIDYPDFVIDRSLDSSALRDLVDFKPPAWPELVEAMNNEYNSYFKPH